VPKLEAAQATRSAFPAAFRQARAAETGAPQTYAWIRAHHVCAWQPVRI